MYVIPTFYIYPIECNFCIYLHVSPFCDPLGFFVMQMEVVRKMVTCIICLSSHCCTLPRQSYSHFQCLFMCAAQCACSAPRCNIFEKVLIVHCYGSEIHAIYFKDSAVVVYCVYFRYTLSLSEGTNAEAYILVPHSKKLC